MSPATNNPALINRVPFTPFLRDTRVQKQRFVVREIPVSRDSIGLFEVFDTDTGEIIADCVWIQWAKKIARGLNNDYNNETLEWNNA